MKLKVLIGLLLFAGMVYGQSSTKILTVSDYLKIRNSVKLQGVKNVFAAADTNDQSNAVTPKWVTGKTGALRTELNAAINTADTINWTAFDSTEVVTTSSFTPTASTGVPITYRVEYAGTATALGELLTLARHKHSYIIINSTGNTLNLPEDVYKTSSTTETTMATGTTAKFTYDYYRGKIWIMYIH